MDNLEIIQTLCDIIGMQSRIISKQAETLEQAKIACADAEIREVNELIDRVLGKEARWESG